MIADGARGDDVRLHAWVVMSNHLHVLASDGELPVLSWAASFRKRFALHERKAIAWCLPEEARTGPFWLRGGGYARVIWSRQEYHQKLRYIHENPVRAGLCARMSAWRWSSAIDVYAPPRAEMPVLTPPPEHLIDLLWWKQPCIDREAWRRLEGPGVCAV